MIGNNLDNTTELYMIKYTFGEIFSSGGATLYKNPLIRLCYSFPDPDSEFPIWKNIPVWYQHATILSNQLNKTSSMNQNVEGLTREIGEKITIQPKYAGITYKLFASTHNIRITL